MKLKQLCPIFTFLLLFAKLGYAEIRSVDSLKPIQEALQESDQDTLLLLDIGGTILAYPDAVLHAAHAEWKRAWFQRNCQNMTREEKSILSQIVENNPKSLQLLDPDWPTLISSAQVKGVKTAAFTKGICSSLLKGVCADRLKSLSISFKKGLTEIPPGKTYAYCDGIIETEADLKGPVLQELLLRIPKRPTKLIFVDDKEEQVQSINSVCREAGIPCIAFHYLRNHAVPPLDTVIADLQLRTLVEKKRWLSEEDARQEHQQVEHTIQVWGLTFNAFWRNWIQ